MDDIVKEAGLSDNWHVLDQPPIRPGTPQKGSPPSQNGTGNYFQGSISPSLQHDAVFVGTKYGTPTVPTIGLMPLGISGIGAFNAATFSLIPQAGGSGKIIPPIVPDSGQFFEVNGDGIFSLMFSINGVIL